ncbi:MAG: hypothetical protein Q9169_006044, partial [Polycauliona sp. 2 TL-2023]
MSTEPKPQDKDKDGIISSKKHRHRSHSKDKPPPLLITRVVRRLRDGCDEFIERMEDMDNGYRDRSGKKTEKWLERDYEIERRRKKRDARRKEKQERKGGKDGEGGEPVEALMSGGMGGPPHHGEHSRRGGHSDRGGRPRPRPDPAVPLPAAEDFGQEPPLPVMNPEAGSRDSTGPRRRSLSAPSQPDRGRELHGSRGSH